MTNMEVESRIKRAIAHTEKFGPGVPPPRTKEAKIKEYVVKRATKEGWEVRFVAWVGRKHAPDMLVLPCGAYKVQPFFVETKAPKGPAARKGQEDEARIIRSANMRAFFGRTKREVDDMFAEVLGEVEAR